MQFWRCGIIVVNSATFFAFLISGRAQVPAQLTEDQMRDFLLKAKVVAMKPVKRGTTGIYSLTLTDGTRAQDAAFQPVNIELPHSDGTNRIFRDSYKFNIAAFELAKIPGLADMMPVTVERRIRGDTGAFSWWFPFRRSLCFQNHKMT